MKLRLGLSTCPNDTFAFHAILERRIDLRGLEFDAELLDVQQLNDGLFAGRYDISKASFYAALLLARDYGVLRAGAALGFGVGPLIVAARPDARPETAARVLCPGATTTATLLYRCLHPGQGEIRHAVFSDIGPALRRGRRRPRRADPRGPAHLPPRRPGAGGGPGRVVRAARARTRAARRDPRPADAARRRDRPVHGRPARLDRLRVGATRTTSWSRSAGMPRSWART